MDDFYQPRVKPSSMTYKMDPWERLQWVIATARNAKYGKKIFYALDKHQISCESTVKFIRIAIFFLLYFVFNVAMIHCISF